MINKLSIKVDFMNLFQGYTKQHVKKENKYCQRTQHGNEEFLNHTIIHWLLEDPSWVWM